MKGLWAIVIGGALIASGASAQNYVKGYMKRDGTYVMPHYRSSPNSSTFDNYSTKPNINPYTGRRGTESPYSTYKSPYRSLNTRPSLYRKYGD